MIELALNDGVYELALNATPCNEIGTRLLDALELALAELVPERAQALIVYSCNPKGFSAGADLRELHEGLLRTDPADIARRLRGFLDRIHRVMDTLDALPMTTIAAIHGVCFGGGLELALTCDLRIAEPTARFCFPELRLGLIPGFGGLPRLTRETGQGLARELLLTGCSINARRAHEVGLVGQLAGASHGLTAARAAAQQVTRFDGCAMREAKRFVKTLPTEALARERELFLTLAQRPVVREALSRFVASTDLRPYLP